MGFFDSCFGSLTDLVDKDSYSLHLTLDVLDTDAQQYIRSRDNLVKWCFYDASNLLANLEQEEELHSRYFALRGAPGVFFSMQLSFVQGAVQFRLTQVNQNSSPCKANVSV